MVLGKEVHMQIMYLSRTNHCVASNPKNKKRKEICNGKSKRSWAARSHSCSATLHSFPAMHRSNAKDTYLLALHNKTDAPTN